MVGSSDGYELRGWTLVRDERAHDYLAWTGYGFDLIWCCVWLEDSVPRIQIIIVHYVKDRFTQTSAIAICRTTAVSPQVNTPNLPVTTFCSF